VAGKLDRKFFRPESSFSTHYWPNTPRKHLRQSDKFIYGFKTPKKLSQNLKSTRNKKNLFKLKYVFSKQFQDEKTPNVNSLHQMEQSDANIYRFLWL
jgi:hypothetical protein